MDIIERIDELCKLHNISKYRLSLMTGISQSAFSKMGRQQASLSIETIHRICDAFGISLAQFFSTSDTYPDLTPEQKDLLYRWGLLEKKERDFILLMTKELYGLKNK